MSDWSPYILLAFANPKGKGNLKGLPKEDSEIARHLNRLKSKRLVGIETLWGVTTKELHKTLNQWQDDGNDLVLFHYGGHAYGNGMFLNSTEDEVKKSGIKGLASKFGDLANKKDLVVVLNGCETEGQVDDFLDNGVKAVIATVKKIDDDMAVGFANTFYQELLRDNSIQTSFNRAEQYVIDEFPASDFERTEGKRSFYKSVEEDPDKGNPFPWILRGDEDFLTDWRLPGLNEVGEESSEEEKGIPPFAKFQCNRTKQADRFHQDYKKKRRKKEKVQFIFIHGPEQQGHNGLFERFAQDNIPRYYSRKDDEEEDNDYEDKLTVEKFYRIESSEDEEIAKEKLLTGLFELFEAPFNEMDDDPFDQPLKRLLKSNSLENTRCVSVHAKVTNTAWKKHTGSFIRWILDTFQKEGKNLPDDAPDILIFFSVIYEQQEDSGILSKVKFWGKKPKTFSPKEILNTVQQFPEILILDELHPVQERHVNEWMGKCAEKLENPSDINETVKKQYITKLKNDFKGEKEWKMELLEPKLEEIIGVLNQEYNQPK